MTRTVFNADAASILVHQWRGRADLLRRVARSPEDTEHLQADRVAAEAKAKAYLRAAREIEKLYEEPSEESP